MSILRQYFSLLLWVVLFQSSTSLIEDATNITRHHLHPLVASLQEAAALQPPHDVDIIAKVQLPASLMEHFHEMDHFWEKFKTAHKKKYSLSVEAKRMKTWLENLVKIHHHNTEARRGKHSFFLEANHMSDLNVKEYNNKMVKLSKSTRYGKDERHTVAAAHHPYHLIPDELNWVEKGFITEPLDQEQCGSCYAFSIASSAQGQLFKHSNKIVNLSPQQIVDCSQRYGNYGCRGGSIRNTLRYAVLVGGFMSEKDYPYKGEQGQCLFDSHDRSANVSSYVILPENDEYALQVAVATVGPIACSVDASPYTFQLYNSGIYDDESCSSHRVNHAMMIVGYTKDAWILKNWWSDEWGINGYMFLRKGKNRCAISRYAGYPIVRHPLHL